jgi:hypothetical protein
MLEAMSPGRPVRQRAARARVVEGIGGGRFGSGVADPFHGTGPGCRLQRCSVARQWIDGLHGGMRVPEMECDRESRARYNISRLK